MTCANCIFSRFRMGGLWCAKWNREALAKCQSFYLRAGGTVKG